MSNMAEVNGTDHLVRHEKETKLNGYDNEGYHVHERLEDGEESASDDDRLRIVVTENGHLPETEGRQPLHNGHIHEEINNHPTTTVNGTAVIVLENSKDPNSNMDDSSNKGDNSQKPLDTRLHHYVPVDDIDRKILNGSDGTHVTIPEDAVISFTTGRVKVKRGASNNPSERESIPLETMLPSYEAEDKIGSGLGEKAELEAELSNHKNGLWSEGHNAYANPEGPFSNSEKLNGTSKSSDEVSLPVNNHRKCLSSDVSDTSSETKPTGEKLYFTEENRKLCPGWRRVFLCGLLLIILAVALLLGVLAATGILLAESESKNTRYESGHSLPSIDSVSHAGHSFRPRPSKVPQKSVSPEDASHLPQNETIGMAVDTVSLPPSPSVTLKVPLLNDTSHSRTIVPNALVGEFTIIDENFTDDLKDRSSHGYTSLATHLEAELRRIFRRNGGDFQELKILSFSPGSIKVKFVTIWKSDRNIILSEKAVEMMKSYLRKKHNLLLAFPVNLNSIHFIDVFDECRVQKGGCSYNCSWDYNTLTKTCICEENRILLADGKSCGPKPLTSSTESPTTQVSYRTPSTVLTSVTEPNLLTSVSSETTTEQLQEDYLTTTAIPIILTNAITTIIELFNNLTTTENSLDVIETTTAVKNLVTESESILTNLKATTVSPISEDFTTIEANTVTAEKPEVAEIVTTEMSTIVDVPILENTNNHSILETSATETVNISSNLSLAVDTTFNPDIETTVTEKSILTGDQFPTEHESSEPPTNNPVYIEMQNETTTLQLITTAPSAVQNETDLGSSEPYTINPTQFESKNETTSLDLPTTEPTTVEENETTIGYHIDKETIQIYTLKDNDDFATETIPVTTTESENVTDSFIVTTENPIATLETTIIDTNLDTTITDLMTEPVFTTVVPEFTTVTEKYEKSVLVEITKYDTTIPVDMNTYDTTQHSMYDTVTEVTPTIDTILNDDGLNYDSPINDSLLENVTDLTTVKKEMEYDTPTTESSINIGTISTITNSFLSEKDFNETSTTTSDSLTTINKPPVIPAFNRTPEVRSFDNFTDLDENGTYVPNTDLLITDATIVESSTVVNTFADNSETEIKLETFVTSSPPTPAVSFVESLTETTVPVTILTEVAETTKTDNDRLNSEKEIMSSTEATIPVFDESTLPSTNFPLGDSETLMNTETSLELSTFNSDSVSELHTVKNDNDTTIVFGDAEVSTIPISEIELLNKTSESEEAIETLNTDFVLQNTTKNNIAEVTTVFPVGNSGFDSLNVPTSPEIAQTYPTTGIPMNIDNETTIADFFNTTVSNMEINTGVTTVESTDVILDSELSNSTDNFPETMSPFLSSTTINLLINESESQTVSEIDISSTIMPTNYVNETIVTTEEMFGDMNITEPLNITDSDGTEETHTLTTVQDFTFPTPMYFNESETNVTTEPAYDADMLTTVEYNNDTVLPEEILDSNRTHPIMLFDGLNSTLMPGFNESLENGTFIEDMGNFTTDGYEDVTNETTTNASTGIECREDQFLCELLNKCINNTFMCDGIVDCPDGQDEYECKDTCHSNFMCTNSSFCIMNDARCDGIWDCENGTDEDNCTPTECAKHEVMCLDGSKCIKPGDICDWKYNCKDRSDEVGCVERTTCESGGRFFCNDGLCIPWSLKCDGEFDCKEGEDEGNCTCLSDEFRCNDGKCLKSSSRCDGHQDCHDAGDEMGCVNVDAEHIVSTYEPYSGTWGLLCAEDWNLDDGQYLCQELGFGHVLNIEKIHVSFNGTWMTMRRENLTENSLWTERVSFVESCTSSLAARVECQKFACGQYTGLLHRRKREVISTASSQWPFIGYASTFQSNKGCLSEILTPIWLITSAECLLSISKQPFNGSDWYVRTNIGRQVEADQAQNHEVLKINTHPHSSKFRTLTLRDYDVALIRLKHALVFVSDKIGAICPPEEQVPPGITCFSGVLGSEKPRAPPPQTLSINSLALQIIDKGNCNRVDHFNNSINQRMLCTQSSEGHTICDNDEGTPLMCLSGINEWFLAGMLTYQRFCDVYLKHPAVFSNLFSMRKFLDQVTGQKQYEIPYDSNVYIIIPPTTPSPTMPETTTMPMTTTEISLYNATYATTLEFENATESMLDNFEDFNGTTVLNEELGREETYTTVVPGEFTNEFPNTTETYDTEFSPVHYGMEYDVINTTLEESEKSVDEFSMNKTHHSLITLPNNTYDDSEANITDISITDNRTDLDNKTLSSFSETTTLNLSTTNVSMAFDSPHDMKAAGEFIKVGEEGTTTAYMKDDNDTTAFMSIENATTDFMKVENATTDFMKVENTTDFIKVENTSTAFMKVENAPTVFMEVENATADFIKFIGDATTESVKVNEEGITTEFENPNGTDVTTVISADVSNITINETKIDSMLFGINETVSVSQPLILALNDSTDSSTFMPDLNRTTEIVQPIMSVFNKSSEMHQPIMRMSNETMPINQPFVHMKNGTIEGEVETFTTISPLEYFKNSTEAIIETAVGEIPLLETATIPNIPTDETKTELPTEASPIEDSTGSFEVVMDGEPDVDLAFSIFNDSDGIKFESLVLPEANTDNTFEENSSVTEIYANATNTTNPSSNNETTLPSVVETAVPVSAEFANSTESLLMTDNMHNDSISALPESTEFSPIMIDDTYKDPITELFNSTEFSPLVIEDENKNSTSDLPIVTEFSPLMIANRTEDLTTILPETELTALMNSEVESTSEITNKSHVSSSENTTLMSGIDFDTNVPVVEDFTMKTHLISDRLTIIQNSSSLANITDCGLWDENSGIANNSYNESFFVIWPALGYLQMVSEPKMCAAVVMSSKFVITSLNCLTFRDNQLDPDKWAYVGGLYHPEVSGGGTQNHLVTKIIPYPDRDIPILFYEHDVALVKLKDEIKMDNYSRSVCVPQEDVELEQKCFTTGWTKNATEDDHGKQFYSVPVSIISSNVCNNSVNYNGMLLESLICGTHNNENIQACQMDLGSPLFCLNENKHWEIQGILNFPGPCDMAQPTVFNSVAILRNWIMDTLMNEEKLIE